jgi:hypothetical protein
VRLIGSIPPVCSAQVTQCAVRRGPWSATVYALLRHLAAVGFTTAPQVIEPGFDDQGREMLTFIEGEVRPTGPWSLEGAFQIGRLFRALHEATAAWTPPPDACWYPWFGRDMGGPVRVIGHCDSGPWNIVSREGARGAHRLGMGRAS